VLRGGLAALLRIEALEPPEEALANARGADELLADAHWITAISRRTHRASLRE